MTEYKFSDIVYHPEYGEGVVLDVLTSGVECFFKRKGQDKGPMWTIVDPGTLSRPPHREKMDRIIEGNFPRRVDVYYSESSGGVTVSTPEGKLYRVLPNGYIESPDSDIYNKSGW